MRRKAFTLIELLVVVVIIGILATLVTVALSGATKSAKNAKAKTAVEQVQKAIQIVVSSGSTIPASCATGAYKTISGTTSGTCLYDLEQIAGKFNSAPVDASGSAIQISTPSGGAGDTYTIKGGSTTSGQCYYVTESSNTYLANPTTCP